MKRGLWNFSFKAVVFSVLSLGMAVNGPLAGAVSCEHEDETFKCVEFIQNYDGDTITVHIPSVHPFFGNKISVRVLGVDAPEMSTHDDCEKEMAERAKEEVRDVLENASSITLKSIGKDKYFRVLAEVRYDGKDLAQHLLKKHLAVRYDGGTKPDTDWCDFK